MMVSSATNYFDVKRISASKHDYANAPVRLIIHGNEDFVDKYNQCEITLFVDNDALAERLVAAINNAAFIASEIEEVQS